MQVLISYTSLTPFFVPDYVNEILRQMLIDIVLPMISDPEKQLELANRFDRRSNELLAEHDTTIELVAEAALELITEQAEPLPADAA